MRSSTLRLAWRNLGRNRKRTGLALAAIGLGQFALLTMSGITRGYTDAMLRQSPVRWWAMCRSTRPGGAMSRAWSCR